MRRELMIAGLLTGFGVLAALGYQLQSELDRQRQETAALRAELQRKAGPAQPAAVLTETIQHQERELERLRATLEELYVAQLELEDRAEAAAGHPILIERRGSVASGSTAEEGVLAGGFSVEDMLGAVDVFSPDGEMLIEALAAQVEIRLLETGALALAMQAPQTRERLFQALNEIKEAEELAFEERRKELRENSYARRVNQIGERISLQPHQEEEYSRLLLERYDRDRAVDLRVANAEITSSRGRRIKRKHQRQLEAQLRELLGPEQYEDLKAMRHEERVNRAQRAVKKQESRERLAGQTVEN